MSLGDALVKAVAAQDESALQACFAADAQFRALIPSGLRERTGAAETASTITAWFADSTELDLIDTRSEEVGDKLHISYRFQGSKTVSRMSSSSTSAAALATGSLSGPTSSARDSDPSRISV